MKNETYVCEDALGNDCCCADRKADGDHVVGLSSLVEVCGQGPSGGVSVVRLHGGTAPRCVTVPIGQDVCVACNDGNHDDVADKSTEDGAPALCQEHDTRGNLDCAVC